MNIEQLMGRYFRLKQELAIVRRSHPWHHGMINRLAGELAAVEREIATMQPQEPIAPPQFQRAA